MVNAEEKQPRQAMASDRRDASIGNTHRRSIFAVPVTVTISIGQTRLSVSEILDLQPESVVPLTSRIDEPVDLVVENRVIAKAELIETDEGSLAVKIIEILEENDD